jgi:D-arabinose 1-dehydrogenase-like Zn-dependent alcohol dehydrogenase
VILATVTSGDAMTAVQGGLAVNGTLMMIGVIDSLQVSPSNLLTGRRSVKGWYSGTAIDPLERAAEGYAEMMSGKAHFRVVLKMEN